MFDRLGGVLLCIYILACSNSLSVLRAFGLVSARNMFLLLALLVPIVDDHARLYRTACQHINEFNCIKHLVRPFGIIIDDTDTTANGCLTPKPNRNFRTPDINSKIYVGAFISNVTNLPQLPVIIKHSL